jgi:hypothetical protein
MVELLDYPPVDEDGLMFQPDADLFLFGRWPGSEEVGEKLRRLVNGARFVHGSLYSARSFNMPQDCSFTGNCEFDMR